MDWSQIVGNVGNDQYHSRIRGLSAKGIVTTAIEATVEQTIANLKAGVRSFVIFGEPQSGKTEMMIALNARLLDERFDVVINLLTDSVDLLNQNLSRFRGAGLCDKSIARDAPALLAMISREKAHQSASCNVLERTRVIARASDASCLRACSSNQYRMNFRVSPELLAG
jgi:hypothetical protein